MRNNHSPVVMVQPAAVESLSDLAALIRDEKEAADKALKYVKKYSKERLECFYAIGKALLKAKNICIKSGVDWLPWLEDNSDISSRRASEYMKLAQNWEIVKEADSLAKALQMLSEQSDEGDSRNGQEEESGDNGTGAEKATSKASRGAGRTSRPGRDLFALYESKLSEDEQDETLEAISCAATAAFNLKENDKKKALAFVKSLWGPKYDGAACRRFSDQIEERLEAKNAKGKTSRSR